MCILDIYQRDVTDDAVTLGTFCRCVVKEPSRDGQCCASLLLGRVPTLLHGALWRVR